VASPLRFESGRLTAIQYGDRVKQPHRPPRRTPGPPDHPTKDGPGTAPWHARQW